MDTLHVTTWPWHHSQRAKAFVVGSVHRKTTQRLCASKTMDQWLDLKLRCLDTLSCFFSSHLNAFELRPRTISITIILIMRAKLHISPCRYRGTLRQKSFFRSWNAANSRSGGKSDEKTKSKKTSWDVKNVKRKFSEDPFVRALWALIISCISVLVLGLDRFEAPCRGRDPCFMSSIPA